LVHKSAQRGSWNVNINTLLGASSSSLFGSATTASQATASIGRVPQSLQKVDERIQSNVDATTAQLSSFGLLKSAVSGSQVVAHALANLPSTATADDLTKAAGNFFNAFNVTVTAAKNASSGSGTMAATQSANRVIRETKSALTMNSAAQAAMKKLGLSVQSDGSLIQDAKKFAAALSSDPAGVRAAMVTLGKQVDSVASKELATDGAVSSAVSSLTQRSTTLAAQQKALKELEASRAASQTKSASSQTSTYSGLYGSSISAYQSGLTGN
jgi:hypothetical protein